MAPLLSTPRSLIVLSIALLACGSGACAVDRGGLSATDGSVSDADVSDASDGGPSRDLGGCVGRELECAGECVDPVVDPSHCGSCDPCPNVANASATCVDATCGFACETGFVDCNADPVDGCEANTLADPATCGGCGRPCPEHFGTISRCTSGECTYDCGGGLSDCDLNTANGCETNTTNDPLHCGSCSACAERTATVASCVASACVYACVTGRDDCDGDVTNGCEAELSAPATCGSCTHACPAATGASAVCNADATCGIVCDSGRADCDANAANGCEVDTDTDMANCGGCGAPCVATTGTVATCTTGICTLTCAGGRLECDGNSLNGCEVDPTTDPLHCGSCAACPPTLGAIAGCSAGACTYTCSGDFRDCDLITDNGCEVDVSSSTANCGSCSMACATPANAAASCTARVCGFSCLGAFDDCDGLSSNGCERDTSSDPLHCGACGDACATHANATATCTASSCGYSCTAPFNDCDGLATNGCESDSRSDPLHCGSCGGACAAHANATRTCAASTCSYECTAPFADCDGLATNGCERNLQTDIANCGGCATACTAGANATPTCGPSGCGYACTVPFADCDGLATNGCELNTVADLMNCGACGNVCPARANATPTCAARTCGFTCTAGFDNCDAVATNGCETVLATSATNCGACGNVCAPGRTCAGGSCVGWTAVATTGAPSARMNHTAVWTGTTMIVWGGDNGGAYLGDGSRYTASTNTWSATSNTGAPTARNGHTAVWTGTEMIVWGGYGGTGWVNTGARYNPTTNVWTGTTTTGAPSARSRHSAIWTGTHMIVWGGWTAGGGGDAGDGASYDPVSNTWTALSTSSDPGDRRWHTGTLAGTRMVVWGGETGGGTAQGDGKRYDLAADSWANVSTTGDPAARARHTAVWTGTYVVLWGGDDGDSAGIFGVPLADGGRYDPAADTWTATAASTLAARARHTAVWSGTRVLIWGGSGTGGAALGDGAAYDPSGVGAWTAITMTAAPTARTAHTAVWTGTEMIVWGGSSAAGVALANGARLIP